MWVQVQSIGWLMKTLTQCPIVHFNFLQNFWVSFWGWLKHPGLKKTPSSFYSFFILYIYFSLTKRHKSHDDLAVVKLDKDYSSLSDRICFQVFKKEIWIAVTNYEWMGVTCCQWTQELTDSMWCYGQKGRFYIDRCGSNTVINFWRETAEKTI